MPSPANAVSQESQNASMTGGLPSPQVSSPSLLSRFPLGSFSGCGAGSVEFWLASLPVENAAALVTILNVEPGGYVALIARLSSGCAGFASSSLSILTNFVPLSVVSRLGLNVGTDAMARIAP